MVGGLLWVVKGAAIIATRMQPPVVFEVAPLFFAFAVVGLYDHLAVPRPHLAVAGLAVAWVAEAAALVAVVGQYLGPADWTPTATSVTLLTPFITVT